MYCKNDVKCTECNTIREYVYAYAVAIIVLVLQHAAEALITALTCKVLLKLYLSTVNFQRSFRAHTFPFPQWLCLHYCKVHLYRFIYFNIFTQRYRSSPIEPRYSQLCTTSTVSWTVFSIPQWIRQVE